MQVNVDAHEENKGRVISNHLKSQILKHFGKSQGNKRRNFQKAFTLVCCSIGIIISWSIAIASPIISVIHSPINPTRPRLRRDLNTALLKSLPPINLPNLSNYSIYNIQCENKFIYEPKESVCYPPCDFDVSGTGVSEVFNIVYFIISATALILCMGTLISWLVASVKCRGVKKGCDFQLARASLFMVVLTKLGVYIVLTCIDALGRKGLVCRTNEYGESYLIAHVIFSGARNPNASVIVNILGQFNTFWFVSSSLWIIFGFTNVVLLVFLSLRMRTTVKRQIVTFCIEMGIAVIFPILILSIVSGIDPITTYNVNYLSQIVYTRRFIASLLIGTFSYSFASGYVLTAVVIILTKLRFVSLRSEKITGQGIHLTELEKRMMVYAVLLAILYTAIVLDFVLYYRYESSFITTVLNYTLCVNVNSPITLIPQKYIGMPHNVSDINSTLSVYRGNSTGDLTECDVILNELNAIAPVWILILFGIFVRIEGLLVFVVLIPRCSISCCRKILFNKLNFCSHIRLMFMRKPM